MTNPGKPGGSAASSTWFSTLYDATAADLLRFLLRRTETPEDAADCLAETFLIAWDRRNKLPAELDQARPWLFGVARNVLKRDRKRQTITAQTAAELAQELADTQQQAPENDSVAKAFERLSATDREIIEMLAWDELAPREVAAILGLSPNVVRVRAHRARVKLRKELTIPSPVQHADP